MVPGGHRALKLEERKRDGTTDYIAQVANSPNNRYLMTVCTGAFLVGALGLLDGHRCQVNHTLYRSCEQKNPKARVYKVRR